MYFYIFQGVSVLLAEARLCQDGHFLNAENKWKISAEDLQLQNIFLR
jgi:hypothetical protein